MDVERAELDPQHDARILQRAPKVSGRRSIPVSIIDI
jgi:hypothetical protein